MSPHAAGAGGTAITPFVISGKVPPPSRKRCCPFLPDVGLDPPVGLRASEVASQESTRQVAGVVGHDARP
jgi:hypothetical protein